MFSPTQSVGMEKQSVYFKFNIVLILRYVCIIVVFVVNIQQLFTSLLICLLRMCILRFAQLRSIKPLNGIFHARTEEKFQVPN
jgi:hypothetical protein